MKLTVFTVIEKPLTVKQYITDSVATGSAAVLFKNPFIATAFYTLGTAAAADIQTAVDDYTLAPTTGNEGTILDAIVAGKSWLKLYAGKVETISNTDANRSTREEAATNITNSFLTPQKLANASKGTPETPVLTGSNVGAGKMKVKIINGETFLPNRTNFLAVQLPESTTRDTPDPVVTLVNGQLKVVSVGACECITLCASGKGRVATLTASNTGSRYAVYAYAQNSKKFLSDLSEVIIVKV